MRRERVIQFGEGNFLRGFVDYFLDALSEKNLFDGSVVVVQPIEQGLVSVLNEQNGRYHLVLRGIENGAIQTESKLISVISRGINPYTDFEAYMQLAENPDLRFIISNTTEAGIVFDESCRSTDKPAHSFPGKLTQLLYHRFRLGLTGFILLACELIDDNGSRLRSCVLQYAALWGLGEDFCRWIQEENTFSNTLVDRIVTGFPREEAASLAPGDRLLDTAEPFHLWVIEGNFEEELPLQRAGFHVLWTEDVRPFKKRKVRILNGAHTSFVPGALLAGLTTVGECMEDKTVFSFLHRCLFDEILPTIGMTEDNLAFTNSVLDRFRNPFIKHLLRSIALNSVSKFSVRVLPTILEYKEKSGCYPPALTLSLAMLLAFYKEDAPEDTPSSVQKIRDGSPAEILADTTLWGCSLTDMLHTVTENLALIREKGARGAMEWILI